MLNSNRKRYFPDFGMPSFTQVKSQAFKTLTAKYDSQFFFYCSKSVNEILNEIQSPVTINYHQQCNFLKKQEFLRRYYTQDESEIRMTNYTKYYADNLDSTIPNFVQHNQNPIVFKRKKRMYKLMKRRRHKDDLPPKLNDHRQSVLHRLNKQTLYLEDIEVDLSQPNIGSPLAGQLEELKRYDFKENYLFSNAEVHDIYNPEFSSDDEYLGSVKSTRRDKTGMPKEANVSIDSKEFIDMELVKNDCSQIDNLMQISTDKIVEDFSEFINLSSFKKHINPATKINFNKEKSKVFDFDSQTMKSDQNRISNIDFYKNKTRDTRHETKFDSVASRVLPTEIKKRKDSESNNSNINSFTKRNIKTDQQESKKKEPLFLKNAGIIQKNPVNNWMFSTRKPTEVVLKNRPSFFKKKVHKEMLKSENQKDKLINQFFASFRNDFDQSKALNPLPVKKSMVKVGIRQRDNIDPTIFTRSLFKKDNEYDKTYEDNVCKSRDKSRKVRNSGSNQKLMKSKDVQVNSNRVPIVSKEMTENMNDFNVSKMKTQGNQFKTRESNVKRESSTVKRESSTVKRELSREIIHKLNIRTDRKDFKSVKSVKMLFEYSDGRKTSTSRKPMEKNASNRFEKSGHIDEYNLFEDVFGFKNTKNPKPIPKRPLNPHLNDSNSIFTKSTMAPVTNKPIEKPKCTDIKHKIFCKIGEKRNF